jgi:TonB family protein
MMGRKFQLVSSCALALAALLLIPSVCGARQTQDAKQAQSAQQAQAAKPALDQTVVAPPPIPPMASGPAMDALAAELAAEIATRKMAGVVVSGFSGPDRRITELGLSLRGTLRDSLAKQALGVKVPDDAEIRALLHTNRIAEDMVFSNALGGWIAARMHANGYVSTRLEIVKGASPNVIAELFVCDAGGCVDSATFTAQLILTNEEFQSGDKDFAPEVDSMLEAGVAGVTSPKCVTCPVPEVPPELRIASVEGVCHLMVTVLPDGTANDIFVVGPIGNGLDGLAVDAVLAWKFAPGHLATGEAVTGQLPIEIPFKIVVAPPPAPDPKKRKKG